MFYKALSIAGFDGSGGAGLQADLKTFSALGCYGTTVLTSLPIQNTQGVSKIYDIPLKCIEQQCYSIFDDIEIDIIKIGMLHKLSIIKLIASILKNFPNIKVVIDPVMVAKSGHLLLESNAIKALREELLPFASIITPNIPEAEVLLGTKISSREDMEKAAMALAQLGPTSVLIKGGHLELHDMSQDVLFWDGKYQWFEAKRIVTNNTHGTGCTLSAAIAALLAQKFLINDAVSIAKKYITGAIQVGSNESIGHGNGPVHHFYHLWPALSLPGY